ncbi:hypothetical protein LCGC14_1843380, partial [marine sediment metagenome]
GYLGGCLLGKYEEEANAVVKLCGQFLLEWMVRPLAIVLPAIMEWIIFVCLTIPYEYVVVPYDDLITFMVAAMKPKLDLVVDLVLAQVTVKPRPIHIAAAIGAKSLDLFHNTETRHPAQRHHIAAIFSLGKLRDAPGTADLVQAVALAARHFVGLDHADQPRIGFEGVFDHLKIARLKDMQRQARAGQ